MMSILFENKKLYFYINGDIQLMRRVIMKILKVKFIIAGPDGLKVEHSTNGLPASTSSCLVNFAEICIVCIIITPLHLPAAFCEIIPIN